MRLQTHREISVFIESTSSPPLASIVVPTEPPLLTSTLQETTSIFPLESIQNIVPRTAAVVSQAVTLNSELAHI